MYHGLPLLTPKISAQWTVWTLVCFPPPPNYHRVGVCVVIFTVLVQIKKKFYTTNQRVGRHRRMNRLKDLENFNREYTKNISKSARVYTQFLYTQGEALGAPHPHWRRQRARRQACKSSAARPRAPVSRRGVLSLLTGLDVLQRVGGRSRLGGQGVVLRGTRGGPQRGDERGGALPRRRRGASC